MHSEGYCTWLPLQCLPLVNKFKTQCPGVNVVNDERARLISTALDHELKQEKWRGDGDCEGDSLFTEDTLPFFVPGWLRPLCLWQVFSRL